MEKGERQSKILELIQGAAIGSQEELVEALRKRGVKVTQATLSRDLRELGVIKTALPDGGFRYGVLEQKSSASPIQQILASGNILVLKTESGMAPPVAYKIDDLQIDGVLGTVAGEDTLLVVIGERANRKQVQAQIEEKVRNI